MARLTENPAAAALNVRPYVGGRSCDPLQRRLTASCGLRKLREREMQVLRADGTGFDDPEAGRNEQLDDFSKTDVAVPAVNACGETSRFSC